MNKTFRSILGSLCLLVCACNSPTVDSPAGVVTLAGTSASPAPVIKSATFPSSSAVPDSIVLTRVRVLLTHVRFDRDSSMGEFRTSPVVLDLVPDGTLHEIAAGPLPGGEYRRLRFRVHRIEEEDLRGVPAVGRAPFAEFLAGDRYSIIAEGSVFSGASSAGERFAYRSRLDEEQERELVPPLAVADGSTVTVTLTLDVARWFVAPGGGLLDPRVADNQGAIDGNIKASIDAFEDNDRDGVRY